MQISLCRVFWDMGNANPGCNWEAAGWVGRQTSLSYPLLLVVSSCVRPMLRKFQQFRSSKTTMFPSPRVLPRRSFFTSFVPLRKKSKVENFESPDYRKSLKSKQASIDNSQSPRASCVHVLDRVPFREHPLELTYDFSTFMMHYVLMSKSLIIMTRTSIRTQNWAIKRASLQHFYSYYRLAFLRGSQHL